jgi:hypothetical protein
MACFDGRISLIWWSAIAAKAVLNIDVLFGEIIEPDKFDRLLFCYMAFNQVSL